MYKWFLIGRYLRTKLIAFFAIVAVTLCVMMMLVVMSVMGGFLDMVKERSRGLLSDIVIDNGSLQGFPYYDEFKVYLDRELPDVIDNATPVIYNYGVLRVPATLYTKPVRIVGINLTEYEAVNTFADSLYYEQFYPGTTTLGLWRMPVAGVGDTGRFDRLPKELEDANRRWIESEPDRDKVKAFLDNPFSVWAGAERLYQAPFKTSGDGAGDEPEPTSLEPRWVGPEKHGIIVGIDVINERQDDGSYLRYFPRGEDMALAIIPMNDLGNFAEAPTTLPVRYVDDSRTGVYEIDNICVYADFEWIQHSLLMDRQEYEDSPPTPARTSQLLIAIKPGQNYKVARTKIEEAWLAFLGQIRDKVGPDERKLLNRVNVQTWEQIQAQFIAAVEKEKILVTVLFSVIMMVAVVLIGLVFWMIVEKKTRDVGILKSLGASSRGIMGIFIVYAVAIGMIGAVLGSTSGALFVHYINEIQDLLASINSNMRVWSPSVYSFDRIPNVVKTADVVGICIGAILSSVLGAAIPALHASRVWPVKALRYE